RIVAVEVTATAALPNASIAVAENITWSVGRAEPGTFTWNVACADVCGGDTARVSLNTAAPDAVSEMELTAPASAAVTTTDTVWPASSRALAAGAEPSAWNPTCATPMSSTA